MSVKLAKATRLPVRNFRSHGKILSAIHPLLVLSSERGVVVFASGYRGPNRFAVLKALGLM